MVVQPAQKDRRAVTSVVLGALGVPYPFLVFSVAALLLAIPARRRARAINDPRAQRLATVAFVLAWVGIANSILVALVFTILWLIGFGAAGWDCTRHYPLQPSDVCPAA